MSEHTSVTARDQAKRAAQQWVRTLAKYREPNTLRSWFELGITVGPFFLLWVLAWMSLDVSYWLTLAISLVNAAFLLRLFIIQHDCGHGSFFHNRQMNDWLGRILGVLTLTPYDVWRRQHSIHHSSHGNLDQRGIGDITTLTVAEYQALSPKRKILYRLYRHPLITFGLGPFYLFFVLQRVPMGLMSGPRYWVSAMGTNIAILVLLGLFLAFEGFMPIFLIFVPSTLLAATAGVWLFYVQHQFEDTHWDSEADWALHESALEGSSHYVLPPVLQWLSGNIGIHHVHHLYSRIPFYRLPEVLKDHQDLAEHKRMTIMESLRTARLHLWCEERRQLVSFSQVKA